MFHRCAFRSGVPAKAGSKTFLCVRQFRTMQAGGGESMEGGKVLAFRQRDDRDGDGGMQAPKDG